MEKVKFPPRIILTLQSNAPNYDVSENYGRRGGYYGDSEESGSGYKSICIYVQNGLAKYVDLFREVARGVLKVQSNNMRRYPLLVFGFGNPDFLQHEKKFFDFGYLGDIQSSNIVADTIARVSGPDPASPAIIPELYPRKGMRIPYLGKTKIEREDLLVIIGKEKEVLINEAFKSLITGKLRKQILKVTICDEQVVFEIKPSFEYIPLT